MSGYILCQVKRAKNPYYISNISTNIYSIEELCYYLYHNIYLLDETIINEQLLVWMKEELHLRRLYQRLYVLLEEKKNIGEFILPIFKEINYLSHDQFREMNGPALQTQKQATPTSSRPLALESSGSRSSRRLCGKKSRETTLLTTKNISMRSRFTRKR